MATLHFKSDGSLDLRFRSSREALRAAVAAGAPPPRASTAATAAPSSPTRLVFKKDGTLDMRYSASKAAAKAAEDEGRPPPRDDPPEADAAEPADCADAAAAGGVAAAAAADGAADGIAAAAIGDGVAADDSATAAAAQDVHDMHEIAGVAFLATDDGAIALAQVHAGECASCFEDLGDAPGGGVRICGLGADGHTVCIPCGVSLVRTQIAAGVESFNCSLCNRAAPRTVRFEAVEHLVAAGLVAAPGGVAPLSELELRRFRNILIASAARGAGDAAWVCPGATCQGVVWTDLRLADAWHAGDGPNLRLDALRDAHATASPTGGAVRGSAAAGAGAEGSAEATGGPAVYIIDFSDSAGYKVRRRPSFSAPIMGALLSTDTRIVSQSDNGTKSLLVAGVSANGRWARLRAADVPLVDAAAVEGQANVDLVRADDTVGWLSFFSAPGSQRPFLQRDHARSAIAAAASTGPPGLRAECGVCTAPLCIRCGSEWTAAHVGVACAAAAAARAAAVDIAGLGAAAVGLKACPSCGFGGVHYRGHHCHHIQPCVGPHDAGGCPQCHIHYCFACLFIFPGKLSVAHNRPSGERCGLFCDATCDCVPCPDCRPRAPCPFI
jgi:hypothetical protein